MDTESKQKDLWVLCPTCRWKLARKAGPGRFETKMKAKRKNAYLEVEVVIGAIVCPGCGYKQSIPAIAEECDEPKEHKQCQISKKEP